MVLSMFGLSAVYWGVNVAGLIQRTLDRFIRLVDEEVEYPTLLNAIILVNVSLLCRCKIEKLKI